MKNHSVRLILNGKEREAMCESRTTLLDFIRHDKLVLPNDFSFCT